MAPAPTPVPPPAPESSSLPALSRRAALRLLSATATAALFCASLPGRALARVLDYFPIRTVEKHIFAFEPGSGDIVTLNAAGEEVREPYRLTVDGLVASPLALTYAELTALPQTEQVSDFHCVEGWSVLDVAWSGVRFKEFVERAKPTQDAAYVVFHSLGETPSKPRGQAHYVESFPLADLLDPDGQYLLALGVDGKPLPRHRGAPARVVCPYDLAYKSIKFVTRIEFRAEKQPGWWTLANPVYPWFAPVKEKRLSPKYRPGFHTRKG